VLETALALELVPVLEREQVQALVLELVLEPELVLVLVLVRHIQPPPNRSPL